MRAVAIVQPLLEIPGSIATAWATPMTSAVRQESLLAIQMDAAIDPGSSGGPLVRDGRLVGVAMQGFKDSAIGCAVPAPLVRHFLDDVADGRLDGIPELGLRWQGLESATLKASL